MRTAQTLLSPQAVTTYIISMTHGVSDMLEVLLLAKEVGLLRWSWREGEQHLESAIDVVPLFETIDDLQRCDGLMRSLYGAPAYRRHLDARGNFQEIMLGYSDSSKDGGFFAANATLYHTQARLAAACRDAGVRTRFFHGRGGRWDAAADAPTARSCPSRRAASMERSASRNRAKSSRSATACRRSGTGTWSRSSMPR